MLGAKGLKFTCAITIISFFILTIQCNPVLLLLTSLSLTNTKHICLSESASLAIKLKNLFSPLSSAQYDMRCSGY
jgi:hypothetical protein